MKEKISKNNIKYGLSLTAILLYLNFNK